MKNYEDFKATITSDVLESIKIEVLDKLNQHLEENPIEDTNKELIWFNRSYNVAVTMKLIEKYHNWLHGD